QKAASRSRRAQRWEHSGKPDRPSRSQTGPAKPQSDHSNPFYYARPAIRQPLDDAFPGFDRAGAAGEKIAPMCNPQGRKIMEPKKYRITQHQSELAVRVVGDSQADLFSNSGFALFDVMVADLEKVEAREKLPLEVEGTDRDDLMVNWVRELLYLYQGSGYLLREFHVREVKDTLVKAEVS